MASLKRRIEMLEAIRPSGLCYFCTLRQLSGDASISEHCLHPERGVNYEDMLLVLKHSAEQTGG